MDVDRQPNPPDDHVTEAWSFGSNYHPCSQSRKMSIGVVIDSVAKCRVQNVKQAEDYVPAASVKTSSKVIFAEDSTTVAQNTSSKGDFKGDRKKKKIPSTNAIREPIEKQTSPWISIKSVHPTLEAVTPAEQPSSVQALVEMCNRSNEVEIGPTSCSLRSFRKQTRTLQFDKSNQKKTSLMTTEEKVKKDGATEREGIASMAAVESVPDKEVKGNKTIKMENAGSETLRLKLWEILGTVSSPSKQCSIPPVLEQDAKVLVPENKDSGYHVCEPRQNSDSIESDTQSHECTIKRPITRSLTRKRIPAKVKYDTRKRPPVYFKEDRLEKNVILLKDRWSKRLCDAGTDSPLMKNERTSKRKSCEIEEPKVSEQNNKGKDEEAINSCKRVPVPEKLSPGAADNVASLFPEKNSEIIQPNGDLKSPAANMAEQLRDLQERIDQMANSSYKSKMKALDSGPDTGSPTFAMKIPGRSSFPGFSPRNKLGQLDGDIHEQIIPKAEGVSKFKSFDGRKREYKSNALDESSDGAEELESSPILESRRIVEEDTEIRSSKPSSRESDSESSEDSSNIKGCEHSPLSPEIGNIGERLSVLQPNKRLFKCGANFLGVGHVAASSKEIDCKKLETNLEQDEEDALARAITLFAFSLEKVRSKMKSVTSQRSAEILKSVAEGIHMQLQNAEFRIQADMGKITSLNKSKRKHVEAVLQEKQQHLKAIYERFKEEVNLHLQDCESTLEALEGHEVEVKATMERKKASNRKLLLEAEEAIETQLDYAQRRITAIHHAAREKMRQLKIVVAECLKEGILGDGIGQ